MSFVYPEMLAVAAIVCLTLLAAYHWLQQQRSAALVRESKGLHTDATKIEQDLMQLLPKSEWVDFAHRMIHHGRQICVARKPKCPLCSMKTFCPKIGVEV